MYYLWPKHKLQPQPPVCLLLLYSRTWGVWQQSLDERKGVMNCTSLKSCNNVWYLCGIQTVLGIRNALHHRMSLIHTELWWALVFLWSPPPERWAQSPVNWNTAHGGQPLLQWGMKTGYSHLCKPWDWTRTVPVHAKPLGISKNHIWSTDALSNQPLPCPVPTLTELSNQAPFILLHKRLFSQLSFSICFSLSFLLQCAGRKFTANTQDAAFPAAARLFFWMPINSNTSLHTC